LSKIICVEGLRAYLNPPKGFLTSPVKDVTLENLQYNIKAAKNTSKLVSIMENKFINDSDEYQLFKAEEQVTDSKTQSWNWSDSESKSTNQC